ncbi:MAG: AMP-binding protein [Bacteroidales bacterium]|jgi:long-chain acyl-CoA synthetase|nr:AMP-binding protein [Bacteroidales bacterium]
MTLPEVFNRSCKDYANRVAISFVSGEAMNYAQMQKEVEQISALLAGLGISKGDKVAILSGNMPNWCIAYFAISFVGAVVVPILPDFHPDEINNILEHSESKAIFLSTRFQQIVTDTTSANLTHVIAMEDFSLLKGQANQSTTFEPPQIADSDIASIIYTSGTMGHSKGVMLTHRNITFDAEMCLHIQDVNKDDIFLSILPLSHTYENTIGFVLPIMQGSAIYYLEKPPTASVLIPALKKVRPTTKLSVPLVIEKLYRSQVQARFTATKWLKFLYEQVTPFRKLVHYLAGRKLNATFGGRLRFFGVGGAKLDPVVERFLHEARFPYAIGYGLTETSPLLAGANPSQVRHQAIGHVMHGVQVKIDNPDAKTGIGEVIAKGENVMVGYYKEPGLTKDVFTDDGWFRTGDLGCFDKQNRLFLKGRLKTMILRAGGENVYPEEIEALINNVKGVTESLVLEQKGKLVAMVHVDWEEIEKQYQQMWSDAKQYINDKKDEMDKQVANFMEDLKRYVNLHVNRFSQIQSVVIVPTPFEKTATMKIKRYLYTSEL